MARLVLGATLVSALLTGDRDTLGLLKGSFTADELLDAVVPQIKALARRVCREEDIDVSELSQRLIGASRFWECMGIDPSQV